MPKERVQSVTEPYDVFVGWQRDSGVQVGVAADDGRSLFWMLLGASGSRDAGGHNERLAQLGRAVRAAVADAAEIGPDDAGKGRPALDAADVGEAVLNVLDTLADVDRDLSGVWAHLDRAGCNALIRNVRKARDAAFGRDE